MDRRKVLAGMSAALACGPAIRLRAAHQMRLGDTEIMSASDGTLVLPTAFFFGALPQEELAGILAEHGLNSDTLEPPCNVTVMRRGSEITLFDAGAGASFMPSAGALMEQSRRPRHRPGRGVPGRFYPCPSRSHLGRAR